MLLIGLCAFTWLVPAVSFLSPPRAPQEGPILECWMVTHGHLLMLPGYRPITLPKVPSKTTNKHSVGKQNSPALFSPYMSFLRFLHCWFSSAPDLPLFLWFARNDSFSISLTLLLWWHSLTSLRMLLSRNPFLVLDNHILINFLFWDNWRFMCTCKK